MAEILITGMEMPNDGQILHLGITSDGRIAITSGCESKYKAIEVPPHGRLIDADVFWKRLQKQTMILWGEKSKEYQYFLDVMDMIKSAPTIIEASKERRAR